MPNVRTITFAATSKGVTPTGPQEAGVQGDHNATVVVWQLDDTLINAAYRYRCEYVDGSGGWDTTPYLALESGDTISVPLPRAWTAAGGCAVIRLCVSEFTEGREERSIYTLTGRLQYAGRESGGAMAEKYEEKIPALIMAVSEAIDQAEEATAAADAAAVDADEAATAAESATAAANEAAAAAEEAAEAANQAASLVTSDADARYAGALAGKASGMPADLTDVSEISVLRRLAVQGETRETGTGDKSPGNPHALTGITPAKATACGKNILSGRAEPGSLNGVTWTVDADGVIHPTGTATAQVNIFLLPAANKPYFWIDKPVYTSSDSAKGVTVKIVDKDGVQSWSSADASECDIPLPCGILSVYFQYGVGDNVSGALCPYLGLEPNRPYQPYDGDSAVLPTLDPLYGDGEVNDEYDAATGIETRWWKRLELTGEEDWAAQNSGTTDKKRMALYLADALPPPNQYTPSAIFCTHYQKVSPESTWLCEQGITVNNGSSQLLLIYDNIYNAADLSAWKSWLAAQKAAGKPVTIIYRLAQPVITQHDPAVVRPPASVCRVYADQGNVDVEYCRDVGLALNEIHDEITAQADRIAPISNLSAIDIGEISTWEQNYYVNGDHGGVVHIDNPDYYASPHIDVANYDKVLVTVTFNDWSGLAFYDLFGNFVEGLMQGDYAYQELVPVDIPPNAVSMRLTYYAQSGDFPVVYNGTQSSKNAMHGNGRQITQYNYADNLTDLNDLEQNTIYSVLFNSTREQIQNAPFYPFQGTIATFSFSSDKTFGETAFQLVVSPYNDIYLRTKWENWGRWENLNVNAKTAVRPIGTNIEIADLNEAEFNSVFNIAFAKNEDELLNCPRYPFQGVVVTVAGYGSTDNIAMQMCMTPYSNTLYVRTYWGSWHEWFSLAENRVNYKDMELFNAFDTVGCIGDSLASGECVSNETGSVAYHDMYRYSWGQYMARATGNTYYNFSSGGLTTRTWLTSDYAAQAVDGSHECKCYIIGLGQNDQIADGRHVEVGAISDINDADYTQNADTYYGNYGRIIQTLKEHSPKVKFFLLTNPIETERVKPYNAAVRAIAGRFDNCYCIDLANDYADDYKSGIIAASQRHGHYNAVGYSCMARLLLEALNKYMYDHQKEFQQIEFIGTQYFYTQEGTEEII